jgi:hypothetical protein
MHTFNRLSNTLLVIFRSLFLPREISPSKMGYSEGRISEAGDPAMAIRQIFPHSLHSQALAGKAPGTCTIFLPETSPLAAPFILFRLKRNGYSACRVTVADSGLLVSAAR